MKLANPNDALLRLGRQDLLLMQITALKIDKSNKCRASCFLQLVDQGNLEMVTTLGKARLTSAKSSLEPKIPPLL